MKDTLNKSLAVIRGSLKLKMLTNSVGKLPRLHGKCKIINNGNISIGEKFCITGNPVSVLLTTENKNSNLTVGNNVYFNYGVDIGCSSSIRIGNNVKIGQFTTIIDNNYHMIDMQDTSKPKEIVIEDNVWIGMKCTILPGVKIGANAVIASGSIVNKDVLPNSLVGGVPAKFIKELDITEGWIRE